MLVNLYGLGFIFWYRPIHFDHLVDGMTKNTSSGPVGITVFIPRTDLEQTASHPTLRNAICFIYKPAVWYLQHKKIGHYLNSWESLGIIETSQDDVAQGTADND